MLQKLSLTHTLLHTSQTNTRKQRSKFNTVPKLRSQKLEWEKAPEIKRTVKDVLEVLDMPYIKPDRIFCYKSTGSKSRSYARIWSFPKIFQDALSLEPAYVLEVLSRHFDKLSDDEKTRVIIHELLHIPKNFSGALVPHVTRSRHLGKTANTLFNQYKQLSQK